MSRTTVACMALVLALPALRSLSQTSGGTPAVPQSPAAQRVVATYREMMEELMAVMKGGGKPTERMTMIEKRMADEVKQTAPELLELVRHGEQEPADAAAYALRYAPDPGAAAQALLEGLPRFNGALGNNVGLALMHLCMDHPDLKIPLAPLTKALSAQQWNQQQKVAQLIEVLAQRGEVTDDDGALTATLITMLASQRSRVNRPARELLPKITGQGLGNDPQPWMDWYGQKYGRTIDLPGSIYELVQIVHAVVVSGQGQYRIDDQAYTTEDDLLARLRADAATAMGLGRSFGVVIQVPEQGFPDDRLNRLVATVVKPLKEVISNMTKSGGQPHGEVSFGLTISPESDEFIPFAVAVANLRRWSNADKRP